MACNIPMAWAQQMSTAVEQAEAARLVHAEVQQRVSSMEGKAMELKIIVEGLQAELSERTAELCEEVCCPGCYMTDCAHSGLCFAC